MCICIKNIPETKTILKTIIRQVLHAKKSEKTLEKQRGN